MRPSIFSSLAYCYGHDGVGERFCLLSRALEALREFLSPFMEVTSVAAQGRCLPTLWPF